MFSQKYEIAIYNRKKYFFGSAVSDNFLGGQRGFYSTDPNVQNTEGRRPLRIVNNAASWQLTNTW